MRKSLLAISIFVSLVTVQTLAAADDVANAQNVIRSQEQAIARDDADTAYGFASQDIKTIFPQAEAFMAMVRQTYAPVYRHKSFEFGESAQADGKVMQRVHITDADGVAWVALYTLEPQSDGSLKISGCVLLKADQSV